MTWRERLRAFAPMAARVAVTLLLVAAAALGLAWLWRYYREDPWTRDGRVRADIVEIAPDVAGLVTQVFVGDNQTVRPGQPIFAIDPDRFRLALRQEQGRLRGLSTDLAQARREERRSVVLGPLVSAEERERDHSRIGQLEAQIDQAGTAIDLARLNLSRAVVRSSVDGTVTDLSLRPGDFATTGKTVMALVDNRSFYVVGYFEETKLRSVHIGDPARVRLMGEPSVLSGHVASITPAISDRERTSSPDLVPNINPTFSWIRLAQRVPVRIALDRPPPDIRLIMGRTATVSLLPRVVR